MVWTKNRFLQELCVLFILLNSQLTNAQSTTDILIKERNSDKEIFVLSLLENDFPPEKSEEKKEIAKAIVRYSGDLKFTDSSMIGNEKVDELVFMISFIKLVSNFQKYYKTKYSYGYMAVSESTVVGIEKEFNSKIDRNYDIYEPSLNLKAGVRKLNEVLGKKNTVRDAFAEYAGISEIKSSFGHLEKIYLGYLRKRK